MASLYPNEEKPSNVMSLDSFCRICLLRKASLSPLSGQLASVMIAEMLYKITGTMVNLQEQLPRFICQRCLVKLELAYAIWEEFRAQEELLRRFWFQGGGALVDTLEEYQRGEESRRKAHSETVMERLLRDGNGSEMADFGEEAGKDMKILPVEEHTIIKQEPLDVLDEEVPGEPAQEQQIKQEIVDEHATFSVKILPSPAKSAEDDRDSDQMESMDEDDNEDFEEDDVQDADFSVANSRGRARNRISDFSKLPPDATKCPDCGKEFPTPVALKRHYKRHIVRDGGKFRCEQCDRNFASKAEMRSHELVHINSSNKLKPLYECKYCRKIFQRKFRLAQHQKRHELQNDVAMAKVDGEEPQSAECPNPSTSEQQSKQLYFECKYCQRVFGWEKQLKQHEEQHEKLRAAGSIEPMSRELQEALNTGPVNDPVNATSPYLECPHCQKIFQSGSRFRQHLKWHEKKKAAEEANPTPDPRFKCPKCNRSYEEEWKLELHLKRHATVESGKYRCRTCDHAFATTMEQRKHERKHETKPEWQATDAQIPPPVLIVKNEKRFFKCRQCVKIFVSKSNYFQHAQIHVALKTGAFQCTECGKKYGQRCRLRLHLQEKHNIAVKEEEPDEEQVLLHCTDCDTLFSSERSYELHRREHSGSAVPESIPQSTVPQHPTGQHVEVPLVKQEFITEDIAMQDPFATPNTESPVMVVLPVHGYGTVDQQYPCSSGGNATAGSSHEAPAICKIEKFNCEFCDKGYARRSDLNRHVRFVHRIDKKEETRVDPVDTQECELCNKLIKRKLFNDHLKHHENVRLRKFVCELCDKPFRTSHHLKEHVTSRACEKSSRAPRKGQLEGKFKCNECGAAFNNGQSMESHLRRHRVLREGRFKCHVCEKVFGAKRELDVHTMRLHNEIPAHN